MERKIDVLWLFSLIVFVIFLQYPAKAQSQKTKKGDILEIRVFGHDEFSKNFIVQQDGTIEHPFLPNIPVNGLRLDEIRDMLTVQGVKYLGERPIITVRFSDIASVSITVLGQVMQPGQYLVPKSATLQGAITQAGGIISGAEIDQIRLIRKMTTGKKETYKVNLLAFLETADLKYLPELKNADVIIVPGRPGKMDIKVVGEVNQPGQFPYYKGESLLDFIYLAGGPTEEAGLNRVQLISPSKSSSQEMTVNVQRYIKDNNIRNLPEINPGDVIIIQKNKSMIRTTFTILKDIATFMTPILMAIYYFGQI